MIQPRGKFLNCAKVIDHSPDIMCSDKAEKHHNLGDLRNYYYYYYYYYYNYR